MAAAAAARAKQVAEVVEDVPVADRVGDHACCRVALWSHYAGAGDAVRFVRVGTLDEPARLPPDIHIFTASKQPWVELPSGAAVVPEYYSEGTRAGGKPGPPRSDARPHRRPQRRS